MVMMITASQNPPTYSMSHWFVWSFGAFSGLGAGCGMLVRVPVTKSRLLLMPYGVQVNSVERSFPVTIFSLVKSDGSTTLISVTL